METNRWTNGKRSHPIRALFFSFEVGTYGTVKTEKYAAYVVSARSRASPKNRCACASNGTEALFVLDH